MEYIVTAIFISLIYVWLGFKSTDHDLFLGSKKYGIFSTSTGILASFIGGGTVINQIDLANKYGYYALFDVFPTVISLVILYFFISKEKSGYLFEEIKYHSLYAIKLHHILIIILYSLVITAQFVGVITIAKYFNISKEAMLLFVIIIVWLYSLKGYDAVAKTDKIQFIFMLLGFYMLPFLFGFIDNNFNIKVDYTFEQMPISLIIALSLPLLFIPLSQEIHQRIYASNYEDNAKKSLLIVAFTYLIIGTIAVYMGVNAPNGGIQGLSNLLPNDWLKALFFVAILTALLSTIDTGVNIVSHSSIKIIPKLRYVHILSISLFVPALLSLFFTTILSVILLALFIYISGPAFMAIAKHNYCCERVIVKFALGASIIHIVLKIFQINEISYNLSIICLQFMLFYLYKHFNKRKVR